MSVVVSIPEEQLRYKHLPTEAARKLSLEVPGVVFRAEGLRNTVTASRGRVRWLLDDKTRCWLYGWEDRGG